GSLVGQPAVQDPLEHGAPGGVRPDLRVVVRDPGDVAGAPARPQPGQHGRRTPTRGRRRGRLRRRAAHGAVTSGRGVAPAGPVPSAATRATKSASGTPRSTSPPRGLTPTVPAATSSSPTTSTYGSFSPFALRIRFPSFSS